MKDTHTGQPSFAFGWGAGIAFAVVVLAGETLPTDAHPGLRLVGVALLLASPAFWIPPFIQLARQGSPAPGKSYGDTTEVVTRGLYGIARHPQYLGYCMLTVGFTLTGLNTVSVVACAMTLGAFDAQARTEERFLMHAMGAAYGRYMKEVPRYNVVRGLLARRRSQKGG